MELNPERIMGMWRRDGVVREKLKLVYRYGSGYFFLVPALAFYLLFVGMPAIRTVVFSLFRLRALGLAKGNRTFVGLENFRSLFGDRIFWDSFQHNLIWFVLALIFPTVIGLGLAILLQSSNIPGRSLFRAIYFFPQILTPVVLAVIWKAMYEPSFGPVNTLLQTVGMGRLARPWLGDFTLALPALFVSFAWAHYGFCMVIFLAGLQSIDPTLYDAAKVDGATPWQEFWHVTLPGLRNSFTIIYIIGIIASFKVFDLVFVATKGGPGYSTYVLSYYMFLEAFPRDRAGYGAAIAVTNTLIIVLLATIFLWYRRKGED